jgi:hypothetical protein
VIHFFSFAGRKEMNKSAIAMMMIKELMPGAKQFENMKMC